MENEEEVKHEQEKIVEDPNVNTEFNRKIFVELIFLNHKI
jgi:hypothetical protein